MFRSSRRGQ